MEGGVDSVDHQVEAVMRDLEWQRNDTTFGRSESCPMTAVTSPARPTPALITTKDNTIQAHNTGTSPLWIGLLN